MSPAAGPGGPGRPGDEDEAARRAADAAADVLAEAEEVVEVAEAVEEDFDALLAAARRERDEYLDMSRRVQADFENYKKRMLRQQTDHLERAAEDLVTKVLPVLDAFDLARAHLGDGGDAGPEGKALLAASGLLADTLAKEGLERIDDPGAPFDPTMHEAVDRVDASDGPPTGAPEGSGAGVASGPGSSDASDASDASGGHGDAGGPVVDGVLRAGYRWKGRVIRPAMVRVRG
jgi:molecular chaperone GrpE